MFLFEGPFGRVLHTGDFRWEACYQEELMRHPLFTCAAIDTLHLDNTYANPRRGLLQLCCSQHVIHTPSRAHESADASPAPYQGVHVTNARMTTCLITDRARAITVRAYGWHVQVRLSKQVAGVRGCARASAAAPETCCGHRCGQPGQG